MTPLPRTRQALLSGIEAGLHLGAQLCVSLHGEVVADLAVGENRPGEPLTPEHLMLWLSSSKPVTAVAIAQLWERGMLALDDPVARHIPEFAAHGKERITLRHLLTHTAGIRKLDVGWPAKSWDEIVAGIAAMKPEPRWAPGRKAGYHTMSSWFMLGEVVRRIDGRDLSVYVREEIFAPLGMADSWIGMPAERYHAYRAAGRVGALWGTEGPEPVAVGWDSEARCVHPNPGGNGYGPMRELGRFYEMLLGHRARLLSPQAVEAISARHRAGLLDQTFQHVLDWGLGVIVNSAQHGAETVPYGYGHHASPRTFGHSGNRSSVGFADPEAGLAVALAMNGMPALDRHEARQRAVLDAVYEDLGLVL